MSSQTVEVTPEFSQFASQLVAEGRYASTSDVLQAAMEALHREDEENRILEKLAEEGEASGIAEGDVIGRICEEVGLRRPSGI
jgi:antitoxin ParD1/3/4